MKQKRDALRPLKQRETYPRTRRALHEYVAAAGDGYRIRFIVTNALEQPAADQVRELAEDLRPPRNVCRRVWKFDVCRF